MPTIVYDLEANVEAFNQGLEGAKDSLANANKAALALTGAVAAMAAGAKSLLDELEAVVDETNTLSKASGLSAASISGLRQAARATGKSLTDLVPKNLAKNMLAARDGSKAMAEGFEALGVEVTDAEGNLRDADAVFRETIDGLTGMENQTEAAALAATLLGKQGRQLLSAFEDSEGFDRFVEQANEFGFRTGPEAVAAVGRWQKANANLSLAFDELKQNVIDAFGGPDGISANIEAFTLGFLATIEFIQKVTEGMFGNLRAQASALGAALRGDLAGARDAFLSQTGPIGLVTESLEFATDRARSFWETSQAEAPKTADAIEEIEEPLTGIGMAADGAAEKVFDLTGAIDSLVGIQRSAASDVLTASDKALIAYNDQIAAIDAQRAALIEAGETGVEVAAAIAEANAAEAAARARLQRDLTAIAEKEAAARTEAELKAFEERAEAVVESADLLLQALDDLEQEVADKQAARALAGREALDSLVETTSLVTGLILDGLQAEADATAEKLETLEAVVDARREEGRTITENQRNRLKALREEQREQEKAIRTAFAIQQTAAVGQIAIDAARAVVALTVALAALGPGAPAAAAGIVAPVAAAQTAVVLAQKPPKAHSGITNVDEIIATLRQGEAVLNQRAAESLGRGTIEALNRGSLDGGSNVTQIVFEGRVLDAMVARVFESNGSAAAIVNRDRPPPGILDPFGGI
jgi:hypothetical protein